jgi:hypothetical protein
VISYLFNVKSILTEISLANGDILTDEQFQTQQAQSAIDKLGLGPSLRIAGLDTVISRINKIAAKKKLVAPAQLLYARRSRQYV